MSEETPISTPKEGDPEVAPQNVAQTQPEEPQFPENELLIETCNAELLEERDDLIMNDTPSSEVDEGSDSDA